MIVYEKDNNLIKKKRNEWSYDDSYTLVDPFYTPVEFIMGFPL
jgi:hypothetical protein